MASGNGNSHLPLSLRAVFVLDTTGTVLLSQTYELTPLNRPSQSQPQKLELNEGTTSPSQDAQNELGALPDFHTIGRALFDAMGTHGFRASGMLNLLKGAAFPLVFVCQRSYYLCALAHVVPATSARELQRWCCEGQLVPPAAIQFQLINHQLLVPFLEGLAQCLPPDGRSPLKQVNEDTFMACLTAAAPMGVPLRNHPSTLSSLAFGSLDGVAGAKQADELTTATGGYPWRPLLPNYKNNSKSVIEITLREDIFACLYDREDRTDVINVTGRVDISCQLNGSPDVIIPVTAPVAHLRHMQPVSACCSSSSQGGTDKADAPSAGTTSLIQLLVNPPVGRVKLAEYAVSPSAMPVRCKYSLMLDDFFDGCQGIADLEVDCRNAAIRQQCDTCVALLPLNSMGLVTAVKIDKLVPSAAHVHVSVHPSRSAVAVAFGARFGHASSAVKVSLQISFDPSCQPESTPIPDPVIRGVNTYAKLSFRCLTTVSGCAIDANSVVVHPNDSEIRTEVRRRAMSSEFLVWNSLGDARHAPCLA